MLLDVGYRRYNQPEGEPTLYQKKIRDKKGVKYFIDCYHYIFPERSLIKEGWEFKMQTQTNLGTVDTTLFNTGDKTIDRIEVYMECTWFNHGENYYEKFVKGRKHDA